MNDNPKKSISISKFLSGFIISIIGGWSSILLGFMLAWVYPDLSSLAEVYPDLYSSLNEIFSILQGMTIIGGIMTLIGTIVVVFYNRIGFFIILVSGIIAGGNLITIIGAIVINKKIKPGRLEQMWMVERKSREELLGISLEDKTKWVEEQYREGRSFRDIAEDLGEDMIAVRHYLDDDLEKYRKEPEGSNFS